MQPATDYMNSGVEATAASSSGLKPDDIEVVEQRQTQRTLPS